MGLDLIGFVGLQKFAIFKRLCLCFLNVNAGSGFVSQDLYLHGFFSASIKLPADYTAGVVVAFYVSKLFKNFSIKPSKTSYVFVHFF